MKTVYYLDQKPELDFDVLAINSHSKAYVLCWHINNEINTCFKKRKGIVFSKKEVYPEFYCRHEGFALSIIQNKSKRGFLIPEKNKIDFFIKIGVFQYFAYKPILDRLNRPGTLKIL